MGVTLILQLPNLILLLVRKHLCKITVHTQLLGNFLCGLLIVSSQHPALNPGRLKLFYGFL
jgi:hypothetical protein